MRKFVKNMILDLLETIQEGLSRAASPDGKTVLSDCADAVNVVADTMEQSLPAARFARYTQTISDLRHALDALLTDTDSGGSLNRARKALQQLVAGLQKDKGVKIEIVFFPYKASMWDSLESIWKAAKEDARCFVSVVPIPYYEKDQNGRLINRQYEGDLFPPYVDIVPCEQYDITSMKPDIAYIHNPYDGNNYVTSVHPDYYSHALKKHVTTLVYVPYYVSGFPSQTAMMPVVAAAAIDLVAAYSKEDAAIYTKAGIKAEIAVLGNPKIDRMIEMDKNRPEIPAEWGKLKGKKVFFLNTSLNSLLQNTEKYFIKIKALFSLFEGKEDIALLWRPHPLTKSTIHSMRPQWLELYNTLERTIYDGSFGVIDLSPDMGTALAVSDAYIGDGLSSLVYLYALTGKPLYLIDFNLPIAPTEDDLSELSTTGTLQSPCFVDGDAWLFCNNVNALCKMDFNTGTAKYVSSAPGEQNRDGLYGYPAKIGRKLLFPPYFAKEWAEYDTDTGSWTKYPISNTCLSVMRHDANFVTILDTDDFAVFAPLNNRAFVKYHKADARFEYYTHWYKSFESHITNLNLPLFLGSSFPIGDSLFLLSSQSNAVLELNVQTLTTKIHTVGDPNNRYWGIAFDGHGFWLTKYMLPGSKTRQNEVVYWNKDTGLCKEHTLQPVTFDPLIELSAFHSIVHFNDKIWVFPCGANEIFQIDPKTERITLYETGLSYKLNDRKSPYYAKGSAVWWYYNPAVDDLMLYSRYDDSFLYIDAATETMRKKKIVINGIGDLLRNRYNNPRHIYGENIFLTTADYIHRVKTHDIPPFNTEQVTYHRQINANSDGSCGKKTHEYALRVWSKKSTRP